MTSRPPHLDRSNLNCRPTIANRRQFVRRFISLLISIVLLMPIIVEIKLMRRVKNGLRLNSSTYTNSVGVDTKPKNSTAN